jgi:PhzF family phenazine biosynthesis protein
MLMSSGALFGQDRSYRYLHLDVFTDQVLTGNQLAVFLAPAGLSDEEMQLIAREMNFSESTFVFPADAQGTDFRVRIFTPRSELDFAGHPTIGTAFALARAGKIARGRKRVVLGEGIGPVPVDLGGRARAPLRLDAQLEPTFGKTMTTGRRWRGRWSRRQRRRDLEPPGAGGFGATFRSPAASRAA